MPSMTCPSRDELAALVSGKLPADSLENLGQHLDSCPDCLSTVAELASDPNPLGAGLKHLPQQDPFAAETACQKAVARWRGDSPTEGGELAASEAHDAFPTLLGGEGATPAAAPRQVAGYEILGELGRGGMGVVYKARQLKLDRLVALKMILAGAHAGEHDRERFRTEAEAAARLQHPHIVQIHEIGEHDGRPYFSLELVDGGTLAQKIGGTPQPAREAAALVATLARAIHYAHQQGVIHRDLKPANVLLKHEGERIKDEKQQATTPASSFLLHLSSLTPKIADFGLAKKMDSAAGVTGSGVILGTPSYMAPEQASGNSKNIEPAADIYALGAILYELLTGRPPFRAETALDTVIQVVSEDPVPPSRLNPKVARDLETICLKCLEKQPRKRYGSAAALAEDLQRFLDGKPVQARPVGNAERLWRWCRRHPAPAGAGAVAVFTLVALIVVLVLMLRNAAQLADSNRAKAKAEETARTQTEGRLKAVERSRQRAQRDAAGLFFEKAHAIAARDNPGLGVLWLAQSLQKAKAAQDPDLEETIRWHLGSWRDHLYPQRGVWQQCPWFRVAALSPDGKTVLTGNVDGTAQLFEAATGLPLGEPMQHGRLLISAVTFSPDGKMVITGSHQTARIWETATQKSMAKPLPHPAANVVALLCSPDGKSVRTADSSGKLRQWETQTGSPVGRTVQLPTTIGLAAFSPDGSILLATDNKTARLWQADTGKPLGQPLRHHDLILAVAFSPDGKRVLTASQDKTAQMWEVDSGNSIGLPLQHQHFVAAVAFSPDGKTVLTGSWDKTARFWEAGTGLPLGQMLHQGFVNAVAFSPDGKTVWTAGNAKDARWWEVGGKLSRRAMHHQGWVRAVAFSPDGKTVLTASRDNTAQRWTASTGEPVGKPLHHQGGVTAVTFSPNGKTVLTGSGDKTARLWDAFTGEVIGQSLPHQEAVTHVAFSPDGKTILTVSVAEPAARLWDTATGNLVGQPLRHHKEVWTAAFSPDGKTVLTGSLDKTAKLWAADSGKPLRPPMRHQHTVSAVAFSPDGKTVLTGSWDKTACLWETATGKLLGQPLMHLNAIHAVAFSPDGTTALTASADNTARLWDARTGKPLAPPLQHQDSVSAVAFSPDGRIVLTTSGSQARLWDARTGKPLGPPIAHQGQISSAAFSPDGKTILTGSQDNTARMWVTPTPIVGEVEHILLWAQVASGMELDDHGLAQELDATTWRQRHQRLHESRGTPVP